VSGETLQRHGTLVDFGTLPNDLRDELQPAHPFMEHDPGIGPGHELRRIIALHFPFGDLLYILMFLDQFPEYLTHGTAMQFLVRREKLPVD